MGAVAAALQERGVRVTGQDERVYPPMSDYLAEREDNAAVVNGADFRLDAGNER